MSRVSYEAADLVSAETTSPEHAAACAELVERAGDLYNAGPFTPWVYRAEGASPRSTLLFPGLVGGPNWGGGAFDPNSGYVFVFAQDLGALGWMEDADDRPRPQKVCEVVRKVFGLSRGLPDEKKCSTWRMRIPGLKEARKCFQRDMGGHDIQWSDFADEVISNAARALEAEGAAARGAARGIRSKPGGRRRR